MSVTKDQYDYIARVREARKRSGHTQEVVAAEIGVDRGTYSNYEISRPMPQKYIGKFCAFIGVSTEWIINGRETFLDKDNSWEQKQLERIRKLKDADRQRFEDAMKLLFPNLDDNKK